MATKDLSALPKQLGDVSAKLQEILGQFNALASVGQTLGGILQGGLGQTPTSSSVAQSSAAMPVVDPSQASVTNLSTREKISEEQQKQLKADLKAATGSGPVPQNNQQPNNNQIPPHQSQRMGEAQAQNVFGSQLGIQLSLIHI